MQSATTTPELCFLNPTVDGATDATSYPTLLKRLVLMVASLGLYASWMGAPKAADVAAMVPEGTDDVPMYVRDDSNFKAGCTLHAAYPFWRDYILPAACLPKQLHDQVVTWLRDTVHVPDFFRPFDGVFEGRSYAGSRPLPFRGPNYPVEPRHVPFVDGTIAEYLASGAVVEVRQLPRVCMPISVATNSDDKPRLILDARYLNLWTPSPEMRYENLRGFQQGIHHGDFLISVDHKSGYHHVRVTEESRQYLGFSWKGRYYVFCVIPFGWAPACYVYNTISTAFAGWIRAWGVHCIVYLDDFGFVVRRTWSAARRRVFSAAVCLAFYLAGYYVSRKKSNLVASTSILLLGFGIDTLRQCFFVPAKKIDSILLLARTVVESASVPARVLESLCGKVQALTLAVPPASIFLRSTYDALAALDASTHRGVHVTVTAAMCADLRTLEALREWEGLSTWKPERHVRMYTDACDEGWGAVFPVDGTTYRTRGQFPPHQLRLHINIKEFLAVSNALKRLGHRVPRPCYLEIYVDNTSVQFAALRGSSPDELARALSRELLHWQLHYNVTIRFHRVASKDNPADAESRIPKTWRRPEGLAVERGDHRLNPRLFQRLQGMFQRFTVDACAYPANTQCERFIAREWWPDKGCVAADVLSYTFPDVGGRPEYIYCNPPWAIIAPLWRHFREQGCRGVLLFPWLPSQQWFGALVRDSRRVGRLAHSGDADVFLQPSRQYQSSVGPIRWDLGYAEFDFSCKS